ncbi:MAG: hypothetical protein GY950_02190 [bacterium]|nr:hypothetical protein [bacterium]
MIGFFHNVDPGESGGKGKNLIALTRASFPVPPGFVITFGAYRRYVETGKMGAEIEQSIIGNYERLSREAGSPFVSVRSSASVEDMADASFAGQYDTFLYVHSREELLSRVKDCWASLFSERAAAYRRRMKVSEEGLVMAVVVQVMIDPRSAGILFTAYPYGDKGTVMVAESAWGCGDTVVSGKVTPDHFVVAKDGSYTVLETMPGEKHIRLRAGETGPVEEDVPEARRMEESITREELKRLCEMGNRIEGHFGCPQDIEWALREDGEIFILQSRPITRGK